MCVSRTCLRLFATTVVGVALLLSPTGCGGGGSSDVDRMRRDIENKLPKGWKVDYVRDVKFAVEKPADAGDLIIWKTQKIAVTQPSTTTRPVESPAHLYYVLSIKTPFIPPDQYRAFYKKNAEIQADHERLLHSVRATPRNEKGELMPRGTHESEDVAAFKEAYAKLPPYDADPPSHYYGQTALKLRDWRALLLPVIYDHQKEMNEVLVAFLAAIKEYKK